MMPSVQSVGISLPSHIVVKSGRSTSAASSRSSVSNSALRFSFPAAFLFVRDVIAQMIYFFLGGALY